jgi:hypothetical protein
LKSAATDGRFVIFALIDERKDNEPANAGFFYSTHA